MIKYLVLSSGAYDFFKQIAVIYFLIEKKYLTLQNIEKVYGVSSGALLGLLISLNIDFSIIYEYFIERPWHKVFKFDTETLFMSYNQSGLFNFDQCKESFKPLFKKAGLKIDITFKELYDYSKKDLVVYATNCNTFEKQTFSYKHTPNAKVLDAVYMSSTLPLLFSPIKFNNALHIDGGFHDRLPMKSFLQDNSGVDLSEILGIEIFVTQEQTNVEKTNMSLFLYTIITRLVEKYIYKPNIFKDINILRIRTHNNLSIEKFYEMFNNKEKRKLYMNIAKKDVELFLNYID